MYGHILRINLNKSKQNYAKCMVTYLEYTRISQNKIMLNVWSHTQNKPEYIKTKLC